MKLVLGKLVHQVVSCRTRSTRLLVCSIQGLGLTSILFLGVAMDGCQPSGPGPGEVGTTTCLACHDGRSASDQHEFLEGPHQDISCETCHGPGLTHVQQGGRFGLFIKNPGDYPFDRRHESCADCHDDMTAPEGSVVQGFLATNHFIGGGATCTDCHNVHRIGGMTVAAESPSRLSKEGYAALCGECHEQEAADFLRSTHAVTDSANCDNCHDMHAATMYPFGLSPENNSLCLQCHQMSLLGFRNDSDTDFHTGTFHPVDPAGSGSSRCTGCHMPPVPVSEGQMAVRDHTLFTIPPIATNIAVEQGAEVAPPNSCAGVTGCHDITDPVSGPPFSESDLDNNLSLQALYEMIGAQP